MAEADHIIAFLITRELTLDQLLTLKYVSKSVGEMMKTKEFTNHLLMKYGSFSFRELIADNDRVLLGNNKKSEIDQLVYMLSNSFNDRWIGCCYWYNSTTCDRNCMFIFCSNRATCNNHYGSSGRYDTLMRLYRNEGSVAMRSRCRLRRHEYATKELERIMPRYREYSVYIRLVT